MTSTILSRPKFFNRNADSETSLCFQCLSAYNQGYLYFLWVDLDSLFSESEDYEEFETNWNLCLNYIVKTSPVPDSEEIFFTDHEGLEGIYSEYLDSRTVFDFLEKVEELKQSGLSLDLFNTWLLENIGTTVSEFTDSYHGCYNSGSDFAENYFDEQGTLDRIREIDSELASYIDFERVWTGSFGQSYREMILCNESHFFYVGG